MNMGVLRACRRSPRWREDNTAATCLWRKALVRGPWREKLNTWMRIREYLARFCHIAAPGNEF